MDIHKPKPIRNWREFFKEVGIIVLGVCIALAAEQGVEALRHRAQAREMTDKLLAESRENLTVSDYNIPQAEAAINHLDEVMKAVAVGGALPLQLPFSAGVLGPGDAAWSAMQYSALLPIMPKALLDNYWKIEHTAVVVTERGLTLTADYRKAMAAVEVYNLSSDKPALSQTLLLRLADAKQSAYAYLRTARSYKAQNQLALAGKPIGLNLARSLNIDPK